MKTTDENLSNSELSDRTVDTTLINTDEENIIESSINQNRKTSTKSLKIIYPSPSDIPYDPMFLIEKIAFIYIEIVIKRGYKAMTNRPFRNLAR